MSGQCGHRVEVHVERDEVGDECVACTVEGDVLVDARLPHPTVKYLERTVVAGWGEQAVVAFAAFPLQGAQGRCPGGRQRLF